MSLSVINDVNKLFEENFVDNPTYPPPRLIFWETTAGCNLECIHCRRVTVADQLLPQDLSTQEAFDLIDQIAAFSRPIFVLSGGEVAALAVTDAVVRLLPGAIGDHEAASTDSFYDARHLSAPSYPRPPEYRGYVVPEVLRSGDHARIEAWRREASERITRERRPDLLEPGDS